MTPIPLRVRQCGQRPERRQACPAAHGDDMSPAGIQHEAATERAHDVERVTRTKRGQTARARAGDLVEELDLLVVRIDAVDAHRPSQEWRLGRSGGTQELEELPGRCLGRRRNAAQNEMAVLRIDHSIGDNVRKLHRNAAVRLGGGHTRAVPRRSGISSHIATMSIT